VSQPFHAWSEQRLANQAEAEFQDTKDAASTSACAGATGAAEGVDRASAQIFVTGSVLVG